MTGTHTADHFAGRGLPASPFLTREFAEAVDRTRGGVLALPIPMPGGETLPWHVQVRRRGQAEPVGFGLADFQGPLLPEGFIFDPVPVLRSRRLATFDFDHLADPAGNFARWCQLARVSPCIDLSGGIEGYLNALGKRSSSLLQGVRRKERMIEREVGPLTIEHDTESVADLGEVLDRKRAQYRRTGRRDALADHWRQALLHDLLTDGSAACEGVTSRLVAGGRPLAWHFGLRGPSVFHYWFPVHDEQWGRFSPGMVLLMGMLTAEAERKTRVVDLGTGENEYKRRFATRARVVFGGSVYSVPGVALARAARSRLMAR